MLKTALRWTLIAFVVLALLSMLALWSWGRFAVAECSWSKTARCPRRR